MVLAAGIVFCSFANEVTPFEIGNFQAAQLATEMLEHWPKREQSTTAKTAKKRLRRGKKTKALKLQTSSLTNSRNLPEFQFTYGSKTCI